MGSQPVLGHVLLVSFPGQGHVNPLLRLGKLIAAKGLLVTFSTTESTGKQMRKANNVSGDPTPVGDGMIRFEFFDDGLSDDDPRRHVDLDFYVPQLELVGKTAVAKIIKSHEENNEGYGPIACIINNPFIPWVTDLAASLSIPSAVLWVQSCACFSAYYHYQHGLVPFPTENEPERDVQLPNMPLLKHDEFPSFLHPFSPYGILRRAILGQFKNLSKPFCVLMETFQELEPDEINYMNTLCPIKPVGPLFINPKLNLSPISGDFIKADDCIGWLDSKDQSSVVYISFGSVVHLKQEQIDEIAHGLLSSGVSFLWVLKQADKDAGIEPLILPDGFLEKAGQRGLVVQWSPQAQVLAHKSVACFVTHCGWNSTMEALSSGVPVVAFPQWGDQVTDAKYLVDVFKVGIRMCRGEAENKIISREQVERCLIEATSGPNVAKIKENALNWKAAATKAVAEGGSSDRNLQEFVDYIVRN